jgi:nucleoside-diphosphate-sugar epimerase
MAVERSYAVRRPPIESWTTIGAAASSDTNQRARLPQGSKVLVTGATGFIGGRLAERLVAEQGVHVRCIVRDIASAARIGRLPVELVRADLNDAVELKRAVGGTDYVFHCAYDVRSRRQNINGLRNLIEACSIHSVRRLVHVSTFAVYEPFADGPLTEESPFGGQSSPYSSTKLELEKMILDAARNRGISATIIQPSIVYGPFCKPWTDAPAEMLIFGDVILPDNGEGLCNAVYVDDVIDGLILAAVSPLAVGERFIISGSQPVTWATFFTEMARALGAKPPKFWAYAKIAEANRVRVSDPKRLIRAAMGWNPLRRLLQAGVESVPGPLRTRLMGHFSRSGQRYVGETFIPNQQALALYSSKAVARSEKARSVLGYSPHFDFQRGMALTGRYLEWAYGDLRRAVASERD